MSPPTVPYGSRPIRRSAAQIDAICAAIYDVLAEQHPATLRGVFYQLVSRGVVAKTEGEYKRTVGRLLTRMRLDGEIPMEWVADNTRWVRKTASYGGLADMLRQTKQLYRRSLWSAQDSYVEVWLEKEALAGVLFDVTDEWDVPLMVTRGYPSLTYVASAAEAIRAVGKPAHLYYFGDRDPSGVDIPRSVESRLRELAPGADITFSVVAVTEAQVEELHLPTRPTKATDSRSKHFAGESVEVDAIPAPILRRMVANVIAAHVDQDAFCRLRLVEDAELGTLDHWIAVAEAEDEMVSGAPS